MELSKILTLLDLWSGVITLVALQRRDSRKKQYRYDCQQFGDYFNRSEKTLAKIIVIVMETIRWIQDVGYNIGRIW